MEEKKARKMDTFLVTVLRDKYILLSYENSHLRELQPVRNQLKRIEIRHIGVVEAWRID